MSAPPNLDRLRRLTRLFDSAFRLPGTRFRFGLDPILGLIPGIGDLASPVLTLMILWHGLAARVPKIVLARMVLNTAIDAAVGSIPILGDAFDFVWKSNDWNMALLERHVVAGGRASAFDWMFVAACAALVVLCACVPILVLIWLLRHVPLV